MGNPGRRPIPTPPDFADGTGLTPPKRWRLKGPERRAWQGLVPELVRVGLAKAVHQQLLEGICETYADRLGMRKRGDASGAARLYEVLRKAMSEFGVTPSSATRVGKTGGHDPDPADKFFTGPQLAK